MSDARAESGWRAAGHNFSEGPTYNLFVNRREASRERSQRLVDLALGHFPQELEVRGLIGVPELLAAGLILRQCEIAESVLALDSRPSATSASVLVRSQFDHAVTLAWLTADSSDERLIQFQRDDAKARLAIERETSELGVHVMDEATKADLERQVRELPDVRMPPLDQRASLADDHWSGLIPGLQKGTASSFGGIYTLAFRRFSTYEHASRMGLNAVVDDLPNGKKLIHQEVLDLAEHGPFGQAPLLLGLSLLIVSKRFGWPGTDSVLQVFSETAPGDG